MKIKKTYSGVVPNGKIRTTKTTSDTDTYSCNYVNNIIETGTSNGWAYEKYDNGIYKCFRKLEVTNTEFSANGTWFYGANVNNLYFPITFIEAPNVQITMEGSWAIGSTDEITTSYIKNLLAFTFEALSGVNVTYNVSVTGKWK